LEEGTSAKHCPPGGQVASGVSGVLAGSGWPVKPCCSDWEATEPGRAIIRRANIARPTDQSRVGLGSLVVEAVEREPVIFVTFDKLGSISFLLSSYGHYVFLRPALGLPPHLLLPLVIDTLRFWLAPPYANPGDALIRKASATVT
jgi:hypothetical protein